MKLLPLALALLIVTTASAKEKSIEDPPNENEVGFIAIRQRLPEVEQPTTETEPPIGSFGIINVPGEMIKPKPPSTTEEGDHLSSLLATADKFHKTHQFSQALEIIEKARKEHPDIPLLWEWKAIYLNLAGEHEQSLSAWLDRESLFPFEEIGLESNYYKSDSLYHLGEKAKADKLVEEAYETIEKGQGKAFGQTDKKMLSTVFDFLLLKNNERTDAAIGKLWESIPKNERESLGNFHGFNLSELWYWYGDAFGRKDIIKKFTDTERLNDNEYVIKILKEALYAQEF